MPTTPSWNDGSNSASAGSTSPLRAKARSTCASASSRIVASSVRRSRLIASSVAASSSARAASSLSRHSMPSVMSARRPAALRRGPIAKPKSAALACARVAAGDREQRGDARLHAAGADALQALGDQAAVVAVEADDVGDGAERDEIEQRVEPRLRGER